MVIKRYRLVRNNNIKLSEEDSLIHEEQYKLDLDNWINNLKPHDEFNCSKADVISYASSLGSTFNEYCEDELYAIYLSMVSDYPGVSSDHRTYIKMAKQFLEDDDIAVSPSEKTCIYLYSIVLGK